MTDDPQRQKFLALAETAREDEKAADQLHGAMETLFEKVPDDAVVAATLKGSAAFRTQVKRLLAALAAPAPDPAKLQPLIDEWQAARTPFHAARRRDQDYLEKLALRIYR